jgi:hypothetical protein
MPNGDEPTPAALLLLAADAGMKYPLSNQIRDWIDDREISIFRRPHPDLLVKHRAEHLRSLLTAAILEVRGNDGWVRTSPLTPEVQEPWEYEDAEVQAACEKTEGPKAPHRDAWAHAGAIAALLRNVDAENEHAMSVQSLFQLYDAAVFRKAEHGKNVPFGWDNGINPGYTVGPPLFWTGSLGPTGSLPKYPLVRYGTASGCLRR